jgi:NAD(P)-dependent dehydrogenase (short-subunit alcohol dehydrogenase family)
MLGGALANTAHTELGRATPSCPDILITGGSDGISLAVAKLLAAPGDARVTLVARSEARLREAVAQLAGAGHDFIAADLSEPEGIDLVAKRLAARHYD